MLQQKLNTYTEIIVLSKHVNRYAFQTSINQLFEGAQLGKDDWRADD